MTLEELISNSIAERDARRAELEAKQVVEAARYEALLRNIVELAREQFIESIPEPLRPYLIYDGERPHEGVLRGYPDWYPSKFALEAPGLHPMKLTVHAQDGRLRIENISINGNKYGANWSDAIADAAEEFQARERRATSKR